MVLADPLPLVHQFLVHHCNLTCRPTEADEPKFEPVAEAFTECWFCNHAIYSRSSAFRYIDHLEYRYPFFEGLGITFCGFPDSRKDIFQTPGFHSFVFVVSHIEIMDDLRHLPQNLVFQPKSLDQYLKGAHFAGVRKLSSPNIKR